MVERGDHQVTGTDAPRPLDAGTGERYVLTNQPERCGRQRRGTYPWVQDQSNERGWRP